MSRIAVSVGCPCGVGPEVSVVAAAEAEGDRPLLVGDFAAIVRAAEIRGLDARRLVPVEPEHAWSLPAHAIPVWQPTRDLAARDRSPGKPTRASGAAQLAWIDAACDLARAGVADAMTTGPVSKEAIHASGAPGASKFLGHTEHLQRRLHAREVVMAFWSKELTTALVTTHLPLAKVPRAITAAAVSTATFWLGDLLAKLALTHAARASRASRPRLAIAALNPHAGEGGLLGKDESRITAGIARARARLAKAEVAVDLAGPVPAESAFRLAVAGAYDGVVAMYHDQATIPMKLVGFGEAVNVSLGLPIVRTSVDHGTAYDRAGKGTADARGMKEALALAALLSVGGTPKGAPAKARATRRRRTRSP